MRVSHGLVCVLALTLAAGQAQAQKTEAQKATAANFAKSFIESILRGETPQPW